VADPSPPPPPSAGRSASLERSLQWTLGLLVPVVILALTAAAAWMLGATAEQFVASRLRHDADALLAGLTPEATAIDRPLPPVYAQPFSGHYYAVRLGDGRLIRSRSLWDFVLEVDPLTPGATALEHRRGPLGQHLLLWRSGYERDGRAFTVAVAEDVNPLLAQLGRLALAGLALAALGVGALLVIQRRVLRRGFRRIDVIRGEIAGLAAGEVDRLSEDVPAEVRPLVREVNGLIDGWREHLARSRNALGNLAHALKSPLNLILLHHQHDPGDPVAEPAARMRGLIERELRRARLAGERSPGRHFRPRADLADLVDGIRTLHGDRDLDIRTRVEAPERLAFDQEDMLELLGNLLDNAAKWARCRIAVTLSANAGLRISVEDDGPGVPPGAAALLAQRGGRLDETVPGHGLGLAIVGDIARALGGQVELGRSATLGGFRATVQLPAPRP
jgi:signal transduction histidine kinase